MFFRNHERRRLDRKTAQKLFGRGRTIRRGAHLSIERFEERMVLDATAHNLALGNFAQDWTNTALITADNNWSGVPSIIGFNGAGYVGGTGVDPQTVTSGAATAAVVQANEIDPNTFAPSNLIAEFDALANPVVALAGDVAGAAPHLQIHLNATGRGNVTVSYNVRDIDGSVRDSISPVAMQYRLGGAGAWTNVAAGFVDDASLGASLSGALRPVSVVLPSAVNNAALLQVRIITTNSVGTDEWIGIDDIRVTSTPETGSWVSYGPSPTVDAQLIGAAPNNEISGGAQVVVPDPTNIDRMFVAGINGGIWRTTNATSQAPHWTPLTDNLESQSIGALEFDPANLAILLAGTGRFSSFAARGDDQSGLYYTTNSGDSWTVFSDPMLLGQDFTGVAARGATLVAASDGGIYRSLDTGVTWNLISGLNGLPVGGAFDLAGDPGNANRLYAAVDGQGIFRTDNLGNTWTNVTAGVTVFGGTTDKVEISVHDSVGNNVVYLTVVNASVLAGVFRSTTQGGAWTAMDTPAVNAGAQGNIHSSIKAHPTNPNLVFIGGDSSANAWLQRGDASLPLLSQFTPIVGPDADPDGGGPAPGTGPHVDSREIAFMNDGSLVEVNDGGIYRRSSPTTSTGVWTSMVGDLVIMEVHDIAYDSISNTIMIGTQDNGTHVQLGGEGSRVWDHVQGGDGGDVAIDSATLAGSSQSIRYRSSQNLGGFRRDIYDVNGQLVSTAIPSLIVVGAPIGVQFVTPVELNAITPARLLIGGSNSVYESLDMGDNLTEITGPGANRVALVYGGVSAAVPNPDLIYAGNGNQVFSRTIAGNPLAATAALPAGAGTVTDVCVDPAEYLTVFAIDSNQVFMSINGGVSWTDITGNLVAASGSPTLDNRALEYIPGPGSDTLVVGNRGGVFAMDVSTPGVWTAAANDLPDVLVFDLDYNAADDVLVAATLGRGVFVLPNAAEEFVDGTTLVALDGMGRLVVSDIAVGGQNDNITVRFDSGANEYVITDPVNFLTTGIAGASGNGTHTVRVPFAAVTGNQLIFDTLMGNDRLTVDYSTGNITAPITFTGGENMGDDDGLRIQGYSLLTANAVADVTVNHTGPEAGNVVLLGLNTVFFTQTEPLILAGTAADLVINLPAGPTADVLLGDDTAVNFPGNGLNIAGNSAIDGSTFEYTEFVNPTNSLTVNLGGSGDTILLVAMDAAFNPGAVAVTADLIINGGAGADTFNIQAAQQAGGGSFGTLRTNGGGGLDTHNISSDAPANTGNLNAIDSLVVANDIFGGGDVPNISESGSGVADTVEVYNGGFNITGTAGGGWTVNVPTTFSGGINISTGSGADMVTVFDVSVSEPITINTNGGVDTIAVDSNGGGAGGSVDPINSLLTINGGGNAGDNLRLEDSSDGTADIVTITSTQVGAEAGNTFFGTGGSVTYSGLTLLTVNTGTAGDTAHVRSTLSTTPVVLNTSTGVDIINVDSVNGAGGSVDLVTSLLTVTAGGQAGDTLNLEDSSDATGDIVSFNPATNANTIGAAVGNTFFGAGGSLTYAGLSNVNLQAGSMADTVNVRPQAGVTFGFDGNNPTTTPGDTLNYDGSGTKTITGVGAGSITAGGVGPVNFTEFETVGATGTLTDMIDLATFTGGADGLPNSLRIDRDATGTLLQFWFDGNTGGGPAEVLVLSQVYANVGSITVVGTGDNDTVIVDHSAHLINRTINWDGNGQTGAPGDALVIQNSPTVPLGAMARETYIVGNAQGDGRWVIDPDGNMGAGATGAANGDEMIVDFVDLEPVDSDTLVPLFDVVYDAGDVDSIRVENGALLSGVNQSLRVVDLSATFETFQFANKATTRLHLNDGADTAFLNYTTAAVGLTTFEIYGHAAAGVMGVPADDAATDFFRVNATAALVPPNPVLLSGDNGNDDYFVGTANVLANINGAISLAGGTGDDRALIEGTFEAAAHNATLTSVALTGAAPAAINYSSLQQMTYVASVGFGDNLDITSTAAGTAFIVLGDGTTGGAGDTVTVGNTTADFNANTFDGDLSAILGGVMFVGLGGDDTFNVDDSGTVAPDVFSIDNVGPTASLSLLNVNNSIVFTYDTTRLTGIAGAANIQYAHGDLMSPAVFPSRLEFLNVRSSQGADMITVNATTATNTTTVDAREGNDNVVILGDTLSANNLFQGFDGVDQFFLNVGANLGGGALVGAPLTSLQIEGNNANLDNLNRDVLTIFDLSGTARQLNYQYLATVGDLGLEPLTPGNGLSGASDIPVNIRSMETLLFSDVAENNDVVQVTGVDDVDDALIVGLLGNNTSAMVFQDGMPYRNPGNPGTGATVAGSLPGVAGGGAGPDLRINGLDAMAGLTLDGGTTGAGTDGNQAIVYAISENNLTTDFGLGIDPNYFGFGAGILLPGFGAGNAYDTIFVTDAQVTTFNNLNGPLTTVNLNVASFVQLTPPSPAQRPALIVNGGDEAVAQGTGVSDLFNATVSTNYNIQVNGNLPGLVIGMDGLPIGDQLNLTGPGDINVFSDKSVPPTVTVTFSGNPSPFGVSNSSIERLVLSPMNGNVNLIGDNNDPLVDQPDNFVVRGRDIDSGGSIDAGVNEFTLEINGSPPILFDNVQRLRAYGFDQQTGGFDIPADGDDTNDNDTLDIRGYADNSNTDGDAPTGWGVDVFFDEGVPNQADGAQADFIIYHTSQGLGGGGSVSEIIEVVPSGPDSGEIRVTNAADGSVIVVIQYQNNTDISIIDDDGSLTDTDTVIFHGTDGVTPFASGSEVFNVNFAAAGTPLSPMISVVDPLFGNQILYQIRSLVGIHNVTFDLGDGDDRVNLQGTNNFGANGNTLIDGVTVLGGSGNDVLDLNNSSGRLNYLNGITYHGGAGLDSMIVEGLRRVDDATYIVGPNPDEGTLLHTFNDDGGTIQMSVFFTGLEPIIDVVAATNANVIATNADNAISIHNAANPFDPNGGEVTIDGFERYQFSFKTNLRVFGLSGNDNVNIDITATPQNLTNIFVDGGSPTGSDTVIVNGTIGQDTVTFDNLNPDQADVQVNALPLISLTTVEHLSYRGRGGDDQLTHISPAGSDLIIDSGLAPDSGVINTLFGIPLLPIAYDDLGFNSEITFDDPDANPATRTLAIELNPYAPTNASDFFAVNSAGDVQIFREPNLIIPSTPLFHTPGVDSVTLIGLAGDDVFNIAADHPFNGFGGLFPAIAIDAGDPSASDVINFFGSSAGDITANLELGAIAEVSSGFVLFSGVEILNIIADDQTVIVQTTVGDDQLSVSPTTQATVTLELLGSQPVVNTPPVVNVSGDFTLNIDLLAGDDVLAAHYSSDDETINVNAVTGVISVTAGGVFNDLNLFNYEALEVYGHEGDDTFDVTPAAGIPIFIDGGDPIGTTAGDRLNVVGGGAALFEPGPEVDEGGIRFGAEETVSFDHIEELSITNVPCVLIIGTGADDDITVIARDASFDPAADGVRDFTVQVNGGLEVLYIDATMLFIDGLGGDDDIVLRAPAPNGADWAMEVFVAGGPPAAATGSQGDVFELETPGTDAVLYSATANDSGNILIDTNGNETYQAANDTLIHLGSFVDACPPFLYDSSPGGVELFVYDGETGNDSLTVVGDGQNFVNAVPARNERFIHTPGAAPDEGSVAVIDETRGDTLLGVSYVNLGLAALVEIYGGGVAQDIDTLVALGTGARDVMNVNFTASNEAAIRLFNDAGQHVPLLTESIENYRINQLEGDDQLNLNGDMNATGFFEVLGEGPSGSDFLNLVEAPVTAQSVTISPDAANPLDQDITGLGARIDVSGYELIRYNGTNGDDDLTIDLGPENNTARLFGGNNVDEVVSSSLPRVQFQGVNGFTLNDGGGIDVMTVELSFLRGANTYLVDATTSDTVIFEGAGDNDDWTVTNPNPGLPDLRVTDNTAGHSGAVVDVNSARDIQLRTLGGDDVVTVNIDAIGGSNVIDLPMTYDGGLGEDFLRVVGTPQTAINTVTYTPGGTVEEGRLDYTNAAGGRLMSINFTDLEPVLDLTAAVNLVVNGTNANNAINYGPGSIASQGLVSIDGFETIEFANKTNLTINALSGDDVINLNNAGNTVTGLTGTITVNGGDPTASDLVIVNGTPGVNAVGIGSLTRDGATITGLGPNIVVATVEQLTYSGQGGNDTLTYTTPAGLDEINFLPGANLTEASVNTTTVGGLSLLPFNYVDVALGSITFANAGGTPRQDILSINGTSGDDLFNLSSAGTVLVEDAAQFDLTVNILTTGVNVLILRGLEGDDTFNVPGNHPFAGNFGGSALHIEGGNPSASDVLNFSGAGAAITVDLGEQEITEAGFGDVSYSGIEIINVDANAALAGVGTVTIEGTTDDDDVTVTAYSATSGRVEHGLDVQQNGQVGQGFVSPVVNYTDLTVGSALTFDLLAGEDTLIIVGNALSQTFHANLSAAVINPPIGAVPARSVMIDDGNNNTNDGLISWAVGDESLEIFGLEGRDTFNVTVGALGGAASIPLFIDGGDPIGVMPGDAISINANGNAVQFFPGPENDEGGFLAGANNGHVSFDHIESPITVINAPCAIVVGTNADDDISVIARDVSTHAGTNGVRDFTVSLNDGPDVLYIDTADLFIDGLAGDDDIVIRAPAPNDASWGVHVRVAGGLPSDGAGNEGDRLVFETPGFDTVRYTPTGSDTGSVLVDQNANDAYDVATDTLIDIGPFTANCPGLPQYVSSPGGVELFEYDGENAGDDITVLSNARGDDNFVHTPGAFRDEGRFSVNTFLPIDYQNVGAGALTVEAFADTDSQLVVYGTQVSDTFGVAATTGTVSHTHSLVARLDIQQVNIANLVIHGLAGDDVFNLNATLPYAFTQIDAGDPSASDVLNLVGTAGVDAVVVDLATQIITGFGGGVNYIGTEHVNLAGNGGADTLRVNGTDVDDILTYEPTEDTDGKFQLAGQNTAFFFDEFTGTFLVDLLGDAADELIVLGTNSRDLITVNATARTVTVDPANVAGALKTVTLDPSVETLTVQARNGSDTIWVLDPTTGVGGSLDNLLIHVDGGNNTIADALVVGLTDGVDAGTDPDPLLATDFAVVARSAQENSGLIRIYRDTAGAANDPGQLPDISYVNVETVSPLVFVTAGGIANELVLGPDLYEPNQFRNVAEYLGTGQVINVENLAIFPNATEYPGVPADADFFRVVAERTGTLDVQVYFNQVAELLPASGNLSLDVLDANGNVIAGFGTNDADNNERVRIPAVAGQTYFIRVQGAAPGAVNGYDMSIINTAAPVPFDIELLDNPLNTTTNATAGAPGATAAGLSSDTGRSQFDNITFDNDPTVLIRVPDVLVNPAGFPAGTYLSDIPFNNSAPGSAPDQEILIPHLADTNTNVAGTVAGFRVVVFVTDRNTGSPVASGYAQPVTATPGTFTFTFANDNLAPDGSYFISARVEMVDPTQNEQNQGFGDFAQSLEIVVDTQAPNLVLGDAAIVGDGLHPDSDSHVEGSTFTSTRDDNITNDVTPTYWGRAEADSWVRAFLDMNGNGAVDLGTDLLIGQTRALPEDGTNQFPNGQWELTSTFDFNDPQIVAALGFDGLRRVMFTAEDVAGNITSGAQGQVLVQDILLDTQGPQITRVDVNSRNNANYNIWDHKNNPDGALIPTPLVNSIVISFQDLPQRVAGFLYQVLAGQSGVANAPIAADPGHYRLVGDANGIIPIASIVYTADAVNAGQVATGFVTLTFDSPLPDDRYTLSVADNLVDPAGNNLDGESNADEPHEPSPVFPTGDSVPGTDFIARFTVDSRPELAVWAAGSIYVDTNGNFLWDPTNTDFTNRDLTYVAGFTSDNVISGNFAHLQNLPGTAHDDRLADGFDKIALYGRYGGAYRWFIDTDNDGVVDLVTTQGASTNFNGLPVAGNFDGNAANGDEVGLFNDATNTWWLDTNHDFIAETPVATTTTGRPVVGNFDGVAGDDLGLWRDDQFFIDLGRNGSIDNSFYFGFIGVREQPIAADYNRDGIDDLGLWVPDRAGAVPAETGEWYVVVSGRDAAGNVIKTVGAAGDAFDRVVTDPQDATRRMFAFETVPFGQDLYAQFGDDFALPLFGNFDPPATPRTITLPPPSSGPAWRNNAFNVDVNGDGRLTNIDALMLVSELRANGSSTLPSLPAGVSVSAPYYDVTGNNVISNDDVFNVIAALRSQAASSSGEGETTTLVAASLVVAANEPELVLAPAAPEGEGALLETAAAEESAYVVDELFALDYAASRSTSTAIEATDAGSTYGLEDSLADIAGDLSQVWKKRRR